MYLFFIYRRDMTMALKFKSNFIDTLFYNTNSVHTLYFDDVWVAGIHSNPMFFGGSTTALPGGKTNTINVFNVTGTALHTDEHYSTQERYVVGGAALKNVGMFYGGRDWSFTTHYLTRLNKSGAPISADTIVGSGGAGTTGASTGATAIYRGGADVSSPDGTNTTRRMNSSGVSLGSDTTVGSRCYGSASASFSDLVLYYAGHLANDYSQNKALKINSEGTIVGDEVAVGSVGTRWLGGGEVSDTNGLFHGGTLPAGDIQTNAVRIINVNSLTTVGSDKAVGSGRMGMGSSTFDDFSNKGVMFYGGGTHGADDRDISVVNTLLRVSAKGTQLGNISHVGKSRWGLAGACV